MIDFYHLSTPNSHKNGSTDFESFVQSKLELLSQKSQSVEKHKTKAKKVFDFNKGSLTTKSKSITKRELRFIDDSIWKNNNIQLKNHFFGSLSLPQSVRSRPKTVRNSMESSQGFSQINSSYRFHPNHNPQVRSIRANESKGSNDFTTTFQDFITTIKTNHNLLNDNNTLDSCKSKKKITFRSESVSQANRNSENSRNSPLTLKIDIPDSQKNDFGSLCNFKMNLDSNMKTNRNLTKRSSIKSYNSGVINNMLGEMSSSQNLLDRKVRTPSQFIPNWLREHHEYATMYRSASLEKRFPISEIISKLSNERNIIENQQVADWLAKLELFRDLSHQELVNLGLKLRLKTIKKGEILFSAGDIVSSLYVLYEGIFEIIVDGHKTGYIKPNECIGRSSSDKELVKSSTIKAMRDCVIFVLDEENLNEMNVQEFQNKSSNAYMFIMSLDFFKRLDDKIIREFCARIQIKKIFKNDVLYDFNSKSDYMYITYQGKIQRHIFIDIEKENKWPIGLNQWQISQIVKRFSVEIPIEPGVMLCVKELIYGELTKEKIIAIQDSILYFITKEDLLAIFNEKEIFMLMKYIEVIESKVGIQIKEIIERQNLETKKNNVLINEAVDMILQNQKGYFREIKESKLNKWLKSSQKKLEKLKEKETIIDVKRISQVDVRKVQKKISSIEHNH